jgi:hypothetical protein
LSFTASGCRTQKNIKRADLPELVIPARPALIFLRQPKKIDRKPTKYYNDNQYHYHLGAEHAF